MSEVPLYLPCQPDQTARKDLTHEGLIARVFSLLNPADHKQAVATHPPSRTPAGVPHLYKKTNPPDTLPQAYAQGHRGGS